MREDAFLPLFDDHHAALFRFAYRLTNSSADAEDIVQECSLELYAREIPTTPGAPPCVPIFTASSAINASSAAATPQPPAPARVMRHASPNPVTLFGSPSGSLGSPRFSSSSPSPSLNIELVVPAKKIPYVRDIRIAIHGVMTPPGPVIGVGTVVGHETILGYQTTVSEHVSPSGDAGDALKDGRIITLWQAPDLGCFDLKMVHKQKRSDGTYRLVEERHTLKVTVNP